VLPSLDRHAMCAWSDIPLLAVPFSVGYLKVPYGVAKLRLMERAVLVPLRAGEGFVDQRENVP
jgi:hypothetical protein